MCTAQYASIVCLTVLFCSVLCLCNCGGCRHHIRELSAGLKETLDVLRDLRLRAQSKNAALDNAMSEMQGILTPTQAARVG